MQRTRITVRYSETDMMGIVYHANYFPWFEVARTELTQSFGVSYAKAEADGLLMPLTDCGCRFVKSAVYGDTVLIETRVTVLTAARCRYEYRAYREADGALLAEGYTGHAFTDKSLRPLNLKKKFPEIYEVLEEMRGAAG